MAQMLAISILLLALYIGEVISARTKAWIPSIFVSGVLFLLGYWTFFPPDIVAIAGIPAAVAVLLIYLLIVNMGTLLSLQELKRQWRTILIAISGILGIVAALFTIGLLLFDFQTIAVAIPPLVGGLVSALIMSEGATAAGLPTLAVFAVVIYVIQGFAGYPLTSIMLKREGRNLLQKYRNDDLPEQKLASDGPADPAEENNEPRMFAKMPEKYNTDFFKFFRLAVVGYLAYLTSVWVAPLFEISPFVLCLLFGIIARSIGFLERHPLMKANGFGFAIAGLLLFVFDGLKNATPEMMLELLYPLFACIIIGVAGMYIFSFIIGKVLKVSKEMAFAVSLTALYGFPADYIITVEVIDSLTKDEKEREVLTSYMLPPMLVGGFITVTIVSVILAGIFVGFL
ncbi:hypothetical protein [Planococcus lenghuensis]|uniref:Na+/glutamate symporter n=1 Tax=Planococcus lenghuensis TaxID=2213202 RepID=A0A1Q2KVX6_9BACL|nr:hypothetical protein [Planococcus lenghuensis]AQQ52293.1 hypothetical protein B0X71_03660 [Planococcus lenghuensis]